MMTIASGTSLTVAAFGAAVLLASLGEPVAARQDAAGKPAVPTFEVASIKRAAPAGDGPIAIRLGGLQGNRWIAQNVTLLMLIRSAYGPQYANPGQIVGGPSWMQADRFDVTAVAARVPTQAEAQVMLQQMLAGRFKLVVRQEKREMPVYALVMAREDRRLGREMKPAGDDCEALIAARNRGDAPSAPLPQFKPGDPPPPCATVMFMGPQGTMRLQSGGATMAQLAQSLSQPSGRPVLDRTGLSGYFAYSVEFMREPGTPGPFGGPAPVFPPEAGGASATSDVASIFSAVQDQLGLKLDPRREPADVLVIESAQPPTED
jgi:uncharacterized protein (TIGR03435 family)